MRQYKIAWNPANALHAFHFYSKVEPFDGEAEIWLGEYIHKTHAKYSWRAWLIKSSTISIFDCKDPHIIEDLDLFRKVDLRFLLDAAPEHSYTELMITSEGATWSHLREYLTAEDIKKINAIHTLREAAIEAST